jgi:ketosteroid isomerase-like protein
VSDGNADIVRRAIEAFNRRDLLAVARENDPDIEVDWSRSSGVEAGIYRGSEAVSRFWNTFFEVFDRVVVTLEELVEHDDDVIVVDRSHMWGRDGIEVEARNAHVVTLRGGRIVRWVMYRSRADALKAVGLER